MTSGADLLMGKGEKLPENNAGRSFTNVSTASLELMPGSIRW
jgi:hypothetical protein